MKFGKMKPHRRNRLLLVLLLIFTTGSAVGLALKALDKNINLFYSPQQIVDGQAPVGPFIRAGGMVVEGSVQRSSEDLKISFMISDLQAAEVEVQFEGILPDMFREGQGVIALGTLNTQGVFEANEVLAKHDENYMSPEVADMLKKAHKDSSG